MENQNNRTQKPELRSWVPIVATMIETFGWPGTFLIGVAGFIHFWATTQQKQRIIEIYVLGEGVGAAYPIVFLSLVFVIVLIAQAVYYRRRVRLADRRVSEIADEKSRLQEKRTGENLRHGKKP